jgi:hypothetical protein
MLAAPSFETAATRPPQDEAGWNPTKNHQPNFSTSRCDESDDDPAASSAEMPRGRELRMMIDGTIFRGGLTVSVLTAGFVLLMSATGNARDPGFGVGRPGPGVGYGYPGVGVAPGVGVGAPIYALPRGCVTVYVNGMKVWRCGRVIYRPVVQAGRTVYVVMP